MDKIAIVASTRDTASMNIMDNLCELVTFENTGIMFMGNEIKYCKELDSYLVVIDEDLIFANRIDELPLETNRLIFLSKHASESGIPSLLVHFPGNWTKDNRMGGNPRAFSIADPVVHKALTMALVERKKDGLIPPEFMVGNEVTHHGPTINRACTFIEIGSTPDRWRDRAVGRIVAECLIEGISNMQKYEGNEVWIGFGGPHYAPKFHDYLLNKQIMLGHIAPKYVIDMIDEEVVSLAMSRCLIRPKGALIDWKGMKSKQREKIINILDSLGVSYKRI